EAGCERSQGVARLDHVDPLLLPRRGAVPGDEGPQRLGAGDPVDGEPAVTLKGAQGGEQPRPVVPVERAAVVAVMGEQELAHRRVETEVARGDRPGAVPGAAERAERGARAGADRAGLRKPGALLRGDDGGARLRADDPVDRAAIEAERAQRNLHARLLRA